MISTSQKEHLTYTAIGQVLVLVLSITIIFTYVIPWFGTIGKNLNEAQAAIEDYRETETNGISYDKLWAILSAMKWKEELIAIITAASPQEVQSVIKKEWAEKYLSWLKQAISSSDEDRKKLVQIKQKINSILPTLSPMSSSIDEENITLKQYIRFIEGKILKGFGLDSNVVLGLQGISYGDGKWGIPKTIGTFDLSLDFKSTNANIGKLITYVNNAWNGDVLSDSWSLLAEDTPGIMSNPLLTIETFSLQDPLDLTKPNAENSWRATIRFYVRWSSADDLVFLSESITTRWKNLKKTIENAISQCKVNTVLCSNLGDLEDFQLKYTEFARSIENGGTTSMGIEKLSQQVNSLRTLEKEFENLVPTSSVK
jgi:hypothetical protein